MRNEDPRIREALRNALADGDKLRAIKLLREVTGVNLHEAKDRVERLLKTGDPLDDGRGADFKEAEHTSVRAPHSLPAAAMSALQQGRKIEAIKLTREHYGLGLKEAKDLVDAQEVTVVGDREVPPYQVTSDSGVGRILIFVALALAGYFWFFGKG